MDEVQEVGKKSKFEREREINQRNWLHTTAKHLIGTIGGCRTDGRTNKRTVGLAWPDGLDSTRLRVSSQMSRVQGRRRRKLGDVEREQIDWIRIVSPFGGEIARA